ncbi:MAG TPA: F0F1 ATP synthase subunit delta [Gammaproteobacteria bacterium]|nr:F0F1 ATP synthase subunit delta [Gammaproteobacteria bacterium]
MQLDWLTFILEIINFLVLIWILQHFLYKPVLQAIARRKAAIEKTLADANAKQTDARGLERKYRERLSEWEREKERLRMQALQEIETERMHRMAALQQALDQEREKRRVVEERQREELRNQSEEEAVSHGAQFAARLLTRVATPGLETRLVEMALEDLTALSQDRLQSIRAACQNAGHAMKITSAFPLSELQRQAIIRGVRSVANADVAAEFDEDKGLMAGLRISIGPWVLHANLQDELKFFATAERHVA